MSDNEGELMVAYGDVVPGARKWAWSDDKPKEETIRVTVHGLRRLLRLAALAQGLAIHRLLQLKGEPDSENMCARDATKEVVLAVSKESSAIWCEGSLVMSGLFVDDEGQPIKHYNPDVCDDPASIPPWEPIRELEAK